MDTSDGCGAQTINVSYKEKITIKAKSLFGDFNTGTCSITLKSMGSGFQIDFDKGYINDCGVKLSLLSGSTSTSPQFVSYLGNSHIEQMYAMKESKSLVMITN